MENNKLRSEKLLKNVTWSIIGYFAYALLGFVSRSIFINRLGDTLTGVSTLFSSILSLLSLAELGFSSAISIHLYKPLAEGNQRKVAALMNLYRNAYRVIAIVIFTLGMAILPFIHLFIKSDAAIPHVKWYFFWYVLQTTLSYCFAYKGELIAACQEGYRRTNIINGVLILTTLTQILLLLFTSSLTVYLIVATAGTLITNLLIHRKAKKLYPYLDTYKEEKVTKEERQSIFAYIRAASIDRISLSVKSATDNMITSSFVNVVMTGIVGNYVMVTGTVEKLLGFFFWNCSPAVGNLAATTDKETQYGTFLDLEYLAFWIYGFLGTGILCVLTPFVRDIWIRQDTMVLPTSTLFLLILNFFLIGVNFPATIFFEVLGLIQKMPYMNLLNVLINLVVSLGLVPFLGVNGVYIGTVLSLILTTFPLTQYLVLHHHFDGKYKPYLSLSARLLLLTVCTAAACIVLCNWVSLTGLAGIAVKILLCTVAYNGIFLLATLRTPQFHSLFTLLMRILTLKHAE